MKYSDKNLNKKPNIAVAGATGMVGQTALQILYERNLPIQNLYALASKKSAGAEVLFGKHKLLVQDLSSFDFSHIDIALFCTRAEITKKFITKATQKKCIVIDNSSYFRTDKDVPLIIPEINLHALNNIKKNIIANPNCVAIPLAVTLAPLHRKFKVKRVVIATYQSVSGAGVTATKELWHQTKNTLAHKEINLKQFPKQIAFNLIPHIDKFEESGFTKEETKIRNEIKKIIDPKIEIVATCVRVPVNISHSIAANIEFTMQPSKQEVIKILQETSGVVISDISNPHEYSSPIEVAGKDPIYISRIRKDPSIPNGICAWITSDNIRKGAALNAVQILEYFLSSVTKKSQHKEKQIDKVHI